MDINNFSYINYRGRSNIIAQSDVGYGIPTIEFTAEENWFGDKFYYVNDIMGDFAETYPMNANGYQDAVRDYNKLVPECDRVYPLF